MQYIENLNETVKQYFHILSDEFPTFLYDYIETPEMQRIGKISMACGTDYTNLFHHKFMYSNLEHSIGVALIIWHFTKDKKQTLAGLFHDIATPTFKHCIDFMNGDHEKQESTEELTTQIIRNSKEIMQLLERDGIRIEEVDDYHKYPIADNDTPKLSADRLEYTLMNGIYFDSQNIWDLDTVRRIYQDLTILQNEEGIEELGFRHQEVAEEFIEHAKDIWPCLVSNKDKLSMQFLADVVRKMAQENLLTKKDLYTLSEAEIIDKIENCPVESITKGFTLFRKADSITESDTPSEDTYCISLKAKKRYIVPLVQVGNECKRITEVSFAAKQYVENFLQSETKPYAYVDFAL